MSSVECRVYLTAFGESLPLVARLECRVSSGTATNYGEAGFGFVGKSAWGRHGVACGSYKGVILRRSLLNHWETSYA